MAHTAPTGGRACPRGRRSTGARRRSAPPPRRPLGDPAGPARRARRANGPAQHRGSRLALPERGAPARISALPAREGPAHLALPEREGPAHLALPEREGPAHQVADGHLREARPCQRPEPVVDGRDVVGRPGLHGPDPRRSPTADEPGRTPPWPRRAPRPPRSARSRGAHVVAARSRRAAARVEAHPAPADLLPAGHEHGGDGRRGTPRRRDQCVGHVRPPAPVGCEHRRRSSPPDGDVASNIESTAARTSSASSPIAPASGATRSTRPAGRSGSSRYQAVPSAASRRSSRWRAKRRRA